MGNKRGGQRGGGGGFKGKKSGGQTKENHTPKRNTTADRGGSQQNEGNTSEKESRRTQNHELVGKGNDLTILVIESMGGGGTSGLQKNQVLSNRKGASQGTGRRSRLLETIKRETSIAKLHKSERNSRAAAKVRAITPNWDVN